MRTKKETVEALILDAAMEAFSSGDFEDATMRTIAEKANVPTSSLYKYFKNKDSLYSTLVGIIVDRTNRELNMHLAGLSGAKSKLREMARFHLNFFQDNVHIARLVYASTNMRYWYEHEKDYQKQRVTSEVLARIIKDGQRAREIREDVNMRVVNHMYFGALRSIVNNWLYRSHVYQLSDLSDDLADAIYGGICLNNSENRQFVCPFMKEGRQTAKRRRT